MCENLIEKYYREKNYDKLIVELKNFLVYVKNKHYGSYFVDETIYEDILNTLFELLSCGDYEKKNLRNKLKKYYRDKGIFFKNAEIDCDYIPKDFDEKKYRDVDFRTYVYTVFRGELNKYLKKNSNIESIENISSEISVDVSIDYCLFDTDDEDIKMFLQYGVWDETYNFYVKYFRFVYKKYFLRG